LLTIFERNKCHKLRSLLTSIAIASLALATAKSTEEKTAQRGIAFIPWFPLALGKVAGMLLERIAKTHQKTPKQVALAWLLKRSPVMLPIPGTSSIEHLEENVQAASSRLTDEEYQELTSVA
jgi:pyridoxine 4-dehydrogenase